MGKKYCNIYINIKDKKQSEIEKVLDAATDWLRYGENCYIVYSEIDTKGWFEKLRPYLKSGDRMMAFEVKPDVRNGWQPKSTWEWFRRDHEKFG